MKKERYFTPENLESKSREMLRDIEEIRRRHPLKLSSSASALLVLDMQNYFLDDSSHAFVPSAPAIIPGIVSLIDAFSRKNLPVLFTRHSNSESNAGMMSKWWHDLIKPEGRAGEIIKELEASPDSIIHKEQYDAFHDTDLEARLRSGGITQLVISGVMTHLCCETTARSAFVRGYEVFFCIDGTATYNEPFHRATLWNSAHGFAVPVLVNEMLDDLR